MGGKKGNTAMKIPCVEARSEGYISTPWKIERMREEERERENRCMFSAIDACLAFAFHRRAHSCRRRRSLCLERLAFRCLRLYLYLSRHVGTMSSPKRCARVGMGIPRLYSRDKIPGRPQRPTSQPRESRQGISVPVFVLPYPMPSADALS